MPTAADLQKYGEDAVKGLKGSNWFVRIVLAVLVGAGLYVGLPYITSIVENLFQITIGLTKTLAVAIPVAAGLSFLWANKTLFRKMRESLARRMWKAWIYNDPLDYIDGVIKDLEEAFRKINAAAQKLRAVLNKLHIKANELIDNYNKGMAEAEVWEEKGNADEADIQAYFAVSNKTSADGIAQSYLEVEQSLNVLEEVGQVVKNQARVMRHDHSMMQTNLEVVDIQAEAVEAAHDALVGDVTEVAMREYAKQAYKEKVANGKAKVDQFLVNIRPILESNRIEKAIASKAGRKALTELIANKKTLGGMQSFKDQIEKLKRDNTSLYGRSSVVDLDRFKNRNPEPLRRTSGGGTFSTLN